MESDTPKRRVPLGKLAIAAVVIVGLILLGGQLGTLVGDFKVFVDGLGVWGPVAFILGYAAAVVAFVPGAALTLAGGAIFGVAKGTLYVFVAATLGASMAFLVARHVARGRIERRLSGDARFDAIDRAVGEQGRKIVFLLRLSPAFPFSLLNYALGLTRVSFTDYFIASVGMLPGTLLYVYSGAVAEAAVTGTTGNRVLLFVGLVATVAVTVLVTRIARKALKEAADV